MNLREYLFKKKIKHEDFAKKLGIARSTLHRVMTGDSDPSLSLATKIVKETKGQVSYEEIVTPEDLDSDP
jgi:DNA-binding XRE family transcriptional regulator